MLVHHFFIYCIFFFLFRVPMISFEIIEKEKGWRPLKLRGVHSPKEDIIEAIFSGSGRVR